jgi:ABC-type multidrug transport system fused ATPase/permease subunit
MWDSKRSVVLSIVCTRIVIVFAVVVAILLPSLIDSGFFENSVFRIQHAVVAKLMPLYYAVCAPGLVALFHANALLVAIRSGEVFVHRNVRYLRIISWCCFAATAIFVIGARGSLALLLIAVAAAFAGLIIRVIKNVLEAGIEIKDENDYTI